MSHQRNPWQPWEGGLRNAEQVMVELDNGKDIVGIITEYSRVGKERQLVLAWPKYPDFEEEPMRKKVILTEEQIGTVHVLTTRKREGISQKIIETIRNCIGSGSSDSTDPHSDDGTSSSTTDD